MPLTKTGFSVLRDFKKRYGSIKGEQYFYATIKKNPIMTKKWHIR